MPRRLVGAGISAALLLAAFGCGSSGSDVSSGSGRNGHRTATADGAVDASALRSISYHGVQFQVPSDWPVYDLTADPSTCVRFDVHAVYLGHASADMQCPAGVVGRTEALQVEDTDPNLAPSASGVAATSQSVNGLNAQVSSGGATTAEIDVTFPTVGIVATITYGDTDALAQQILQSFRTATP
jgi:hypothetical protein